MRPSYRIVSYRIEKKTLISYRYRIESKKSLSLLTDHDDRHGHEQARVQQDRLQHRGHRGERGPAQLGAIGHLRLQEQAERGHGKLAEGDGAHKKL